MISEAQASLFRATFQGGPVIAFPSMVPIEDHVWEITGPASRCLGRRCDVTGEDHGSGMTLSQFVDMGLADVKVSGSAYVMELTEMGGEMLRMLMI